MRDRPSIASTPGVGSPDTLTASHFAFLFGTFAFWLPFTASTQVVEDLPVSEWVRFPLYLTLKDRMYTLDGFSHVNRRDVDENSRFLEVNL